MDGDYVKKLTITNNLLLNEVISDYDVGVSNSKAYFTLKKRIARLLKSIQDPVEQAEKINERLTIYLRETNDKWEKDVK